MKICRYKRQLPLCTAEALWNFVKNIPDRINLVTVGLTGIFFSLEIFQNI